MYEQGPGRKAYCIAVAKKTVEESVPEKPELPRAFPARLIIAAWLVPGAGHFLQGKRERALILFASIISMFVFGLLMNGQFFSFRSPSTLQRLGSLGEWSVGAAMPIAHFFGYSGGDIFFVSSDYGTAFLIAAGMLNILTMFDAYDIAM